MEQSKLSAEQWQAIAEKLAENMEYGCRSIDYCTSCEMSCSGGGYMKKEDWLQWAKEELGYE